MKNNNSGSSSFATGYFSGNVFDCTMKLRQPRLNEYAYAGVYLDRCATSLGSIGALNTNLFQNLRYGVVANNSSANLTRFMIENLREPSSVGILAKDGSLNINGDGAEIKNCMQAGIEGYGANLDIVNYKFSGNQEHGIYSTENKNSENVRITNNTVRLNHANNLGAINVDRSIASGALTHCIVSFDSIFIEHSHNRYFGILVDQPNIAIDFMRINNNVVNIGANGENLFGVGTANTNGNNGTKIISNTINFLNPSAYSMGMYGIRYITNAGKENQVSNNTVFSGGSTKSGQCGIHLEATPHLLVCENQVGGTDKGIHVTGDCEPSFLKNNQMNQHNDGLYINSSARNPGDAKIGTQKQFGNSW